MSESLDSSLTIQTPAKINLGLRVVRKRSDGYHELVTTFQTVDLFDRIRVEVIPDDDQLHVLGPVSLPSGTSNIVTRTLDYLRKLGFRIPNLDITLEKNIPTGSGLGGGSGNAAGIIRIADTITEQSITERLDEGDVARELGADVPFFLAGGTCRAGGIGEDIHPVDDLVGFALLAVPPYSIPTEEAYQHVDGSESQLDEEKYAKGEDLRITDWTDLDLRNDFEPYVRNQYDLHDRLKNGMLNFSEQVGLSGSGSTLYALFENLSTLRDAHEELDDQFDSVELFETKFVTRQEQPTVKETTGS